MCAAKSNLHENLPLGSPIPAPVNKPSSFRTEEIDICDGEVRIYRDKKATQIWQLSIWVRGEGKYFRKSLRTKDLEIAKTKAKSIFYKMLEMLSKRSHSGWRYITTVSTLLLIC